jgi:hypothetical protein
MARAKDLAALAGLAGLAYAYNKGKDKEGPSATAEEKEASKARMDAQKNAVSGNRASDDRMSNEDYIKSHMKKAPLDDTDKYPSGVMGGAKQADAVKPKSSTEEKPKPAPKLETITTRKDPREAEAGTSRGQRSFTSRSSGDEMSKAAKNYKAPAPTTSSKVADTVKTVAKTVARGPIGVAADATKPLADKATNAMRETYRDLSGKVQYKTPDIPSAAKTISDTVTSGAKKVGSGIADYANRTFTLEGREKAKKEADDARAKAASSREYDEDALSKGSAMRRGGAVKMASGGMTASRRGDGIASRGKTRGKIC